MHIDETQVLRYLGYNNQSLSLDMKALIHLCISDCEEASKPSYIYHAFDLEETPRGIAAAGSGLVLEGNDILEHLNNCEKCIIFAATLGIGIDSLIRISEHSDLTRAVILDACANDLIEQYCDSIQSEMTEYFAPQWHLTDRFSPGYGDFPLSVQPKIIRILNADKKIGLTCTKSHIMLPRKSVTAVIGLTKEECVKGQGNKCDMCGKSDTCAYRR